MPIYPQYDLTHQYVSQSYVRILQVVPGGLVLDGTGATVNLTSSVESASYSLQAEHANTASYAVSSSNITNINIITYVVSASWAQTASYALTSTIDTSSLVLNNQTASMSVATASFALNGGVTNHSLLTNLDYASSGHTGFAGVGVTNVFTQNQTITGSLNILGQLFATQKSFYIEDKDNPGKHLIYGALEGPQNDVFIRGNIKSEKSSIKINLPQEWTWLVDENTITVQLTQREFTQNLLITSIKNNCVNVKNANTSKKSSKELNFYYLIMAERKDVDKLQVRD